ESRGSRSFPEAYAPTSQPLFWSGRPTFSSPTWPLSDDQVDVQPLLSVPTFGIFGGTATLGRPTPAAFGGPHANVHNAFDPGDMADLRFSPRDPIFYAHHSNIDRLWSSWARDPDHQKPTFSDDAKVYFYDEKRQWRFVLLSDLLDETRLGYKYSSYMDSGVPA